MKVRVSLAILLVLCVGCRTGHLGAPQMSASWSATRSVHIEEHPECAACGYLPKPGKRNNDVHHVIPRHVNIDLELSANNLITLCRKYDCHLRFGHFGNYRTGYNTNVVEILQGVGARMKAAEAEFWSQ